MTLGGGRVSGAGGPEEALNGRLPETNQQQYGALEKKKPGTQMHPREVAKLKVPELREVLRAALLAT